MIYKMNTEIYCSNCDRFVSTVDDNGYCYECSNTLNNYQEAELIDELTLHTEVTIDSAHKLEKYDGKCATLHGHTWKVEVWFKGHPSLRDEVGILVDFGIVKEIKEHLDHKYINDVIRMNPTAENLTQYIYMFIKDRIKKGIRVKVRVYETCVDKITYCEGGDFE